MTHGDQAAVSSAPHALGWPLGRGQPRRRPGQAQVLQNRSPPSPPSRPPTPSACLHSCLRRTHPSNSSWRFFAATYNTQVGNNDEFTGLFTAPTVTVSTNSSPPGPPRRTPRRRLHPPLAPRAQPKATFPTTQENQPCPLFFHKLQLLVLLVYGN